MWIMMHRHTSCQRCTPINNAEHKMLGKWGSDVLLDPWIPLSKCEGTMGKKRLPVQCWDKSWLCLPVYLWQTTLGLSNFSNFLFLHLTLTQPFEIMQRPHLAVLLIDTLGLLSSSLCLRGPTLFFLGNKSSNSSSLLEWGGVSDTVLPYLEGRQAGRLILEQAMWF